MSSSSIAELNTKNNLCHKYVEPRGNAKILETQRKRCRLCMMKEESRKLAANSDANSKVSGRDQVCCKDMQSRKDFVYIILTLRIFLNTRYGTPWTHKRFNPFLVFKV